MQNQTQNLNQDSEQNKNQPPKKEPFSFIFVKTLLAILIFTALTIIIIGGWVYVAARYAIISPSKIDLPIVNHVVETQCKIDSDCELAYTGSNICLPCDTAIEEYKCLLLKEAEETEEERFKRMVDNKIFCERCLEKSQHTCKCESGKCEKIKDEKEKSALDLMCVEKVKKDEICSASFGVGYEFNSETRKCIQKGVSGCSVKSPFETLEECQNVCEKEINISNLSSKASAADGWQIYQNDEFGFEFKYPDEVIFKEENGTISMNFWFVKDINVEDVEIKINTIPIQDQAIDDPKYTGYSEIQDIVIDNKKAKNYWWGYEGESWYEIYVELRASNNILFHIDCLYVDGDNTNCENFIDSFFSTFKFIEK